MGRLLQDTSDDFAIDKKLRVYPTNQQVDDHNSAVLNLLRNKGAHIYKIAQDQLVPNCCPKCGQYRYSYYDTLTKSFGPYFVELR